MEKINHTKIKYSKVGRKYKAEFKFWIGDNPKYKADTTIWDDTKELLKEKLINF